MLDFFAVGNIISENIALKGRILIDEIPSGRYFLTPIMNAMQENRVIQVTYKSFSGVGQGYTFAIEPYCVKLFENRWYL